MERSETFFTPLDVIGQLTMRNLDIMDTRDKLQLHTGSGLLSMPVSGGVPKPAPHEWARGCGAWALLPSLVEAGRSWWVAQVMADEDLRLEIA